MTGDYTQVPLRRDERWTGARMQQGRVLLDHDWNLNLDACARAVREAASDAIGWAGVVESSSAFQIGVTTGPLDLTIGAGVMWVDGLAAFAPAPLTYLSQELIAALPATGTVLVYLDVFEEHIQSAEDPADLVDPALGTIDTTGRTRVGYRVRVAPTAAATCAAAWSGLVTVAESTGTLTITRTVVVPAPDPCSPPGDPLAQVPDGLLRVEVLDAGTEATARFAWSYEDGGTAVAIVSPPAGNTIQLTPSNLRLGVGDLIEVSWLARRADRADHGGLYSVQTVTPGAGGDTLALDSAVRAPAGAQGLCARRWDGQTVGAAAAAAATWHATDLAIQFTAGAGTYLAGDWWGARLRSEAGDGLEHRNAAPPDGVAHAYAPLALVDLGTPQVLSDCRPTFTSLVDLDFEQGACTVSVKPGDDLQAALDSLPAGGGELCLAAGGYPLPQPLTATGRQRIVINGAGPATIVSAVRREAAIVFDTCQEIEVRNVRVQGGAPGGVPGDPSLEGALMFLSCKDVVVHDCVLACPDQAAGLVQTCITVRPQTNGQPPDGIRIERNRLQVGAWQTGILVVGPVATVIADNRIQLGPAVHGLPVGTRNPALAGVLTRLLRTGLREKGGAGVSRVTPPGTEAVLHVKKGSEAEAIVRDFVRVTTPAKIARAGGPEKALLAHVRALGQGKLSVDADPALKQVIEKVLVQTRAVGQGIVVAGSVIGTARIDGNLVEDAVQGIHVGVSDAAVSVNEAADAVVVSRNVVHALVPAAYPRDRHGVFVGNARSIHVVDTVATLRRIGVQDAGAPTPVEGIRIHGLFGQFLTVRQSSLQGFAVGIRIVPLAPVPNPRMWLVAETFAAGADPVVDAPAGIVAGERNPM